MPIGFEPRISWLYQLSHNLWLIFFRSFIAITQPSLSHVLWKLKIHVWKCTLTFYCQVVSRFHSKDCTKSNFREVRYFGLKEKKQHSIVLDLFRREDERQISNKSFTTACSKIKRKSVFGFWATLERLKTNFD